MGCGSGRRKGRSTGWQILTEPWNWAVKDILIASVDGVTGFPDAIASEVPKAEVQLRIGHMVHNSLRYVSWKERKIVAKGLRTICTSAMAGSAWSVLESFAEIWDARFPSISCSLKERWKKVIPFVAYPPEIRKVT